MEMRPRVDIEIGEVVLSGLTFGAGDEVGDALRSELGRLVANHGVPSSWSGTGAVDVLATDPVHLPPGTSAGDAGRRIAQAIYRGFNPDVPT